MLHIKDYIRQRLSDPALGPAEIAAAVNISRRWARVGGRGLGGLMLLHAM
jgi:hypothetical protein